MAHENLSILRLTAVELSRGTTDPDNEKSKPALKQWRSQPGLKIFACSRSGRRECCAFTHRSILSPLTLSNPNPPSRGSHTADSSRASLSCWAECRAGREAGDLGAAQERVTATHPHKHQPGCKPTSQFRGCERGRAWAVTNYESNLRWHMSGRRAPFRLKSQSEGKLFSLSSSCQPTLWFL